MAARILINREAVEKELDDEVRFHVERQIEEYVRAGMNLREARRRAMIELGGAEQVKERVRDVRWTTMIETIWQDIRYGMRTLRKSPGFTIVAVLTLALGIGANTAIFSVVNGVLLRPLPYENPDRIVHVWESNPQKGFPEFPVSLPNFRDWREQSQTFSDLAGFDDGNVVITGDGEPERIRGAEVSPGFFRLFGIRPVLGRAFLPEEEEEGNDGVVILSYGFWQRRFGSDPKILERTLILGGNPYSIVGVVPQQFRFPEEAEVWRPLSYDLNNLPSRGNHWLTVIARLKPGSTLNHAQAEMETIAARLTEAYPDINTGWGTVVVPLHEQIVGDTRPALLVLLGAVGFVLLIACVNVANLLLARATGREKEFAIRLALGAGRARLVRQLLTESLLLALLGGISGVLLAYWGVQSLGGLSFGGIPRIQEIGIDGSVLGYSLLLSILVGMFFGLIPALNTSRPGLREAIMEGTRSSSGSGRHGVRSLLVVSEIALALVLLVGAGLLVRSFVFLTSTNPGLNSENVLTARMSLPRAYYPEDQQAVSFYQQLLERIESLPGVRSAGAVNVLPLVGWGFSSSFSIEGGLELPPAQLPSADYFSVTPGYFQALGVPLRKGRLFAEQDRAGAPRVAVISETFARQHFSGENPIGRKMVLSVGTNEVREIIGVVGDVKHRGLDSNVRAQVYESYAQRTPRTMTLVARADSNPMALVAAIRRHIRELDKDLPLYSIRTMESVIADSIVQERFTVLLLSCFAMLALALAVMGIYGVISYSASQRTHEIGIRMALGAQQVNILRLVLGQGIGMTLIGLSMGLIGAFALTRYLESLLFGVTATDPATFAGVSVLLFCVALLACYLPARRATKVDPMVALRYE